MEPVNIPTEIDSPQLVLLWSLDEFVPFMIFMVAGNFLNHFFMGLGAGWVVSHLYRRYKNTRPDGYLLHLLYWFGLAKLSGLTVVDPYRREYLP